MVRCATTWQPPSFNTVTGTCSPASVKTRVMPTFCAITPERMFRFLLSCPPGGLRPAYRRGPETALDVYPDVAPRRQVELHQRVHRLRRRVDDVEKPLVG